MDLVRRKLSNPLVAAGFVVAILLWVSLEGWNGFAVCIFGACIGLAISLPLRIVGAVGSGDVKWFSAAGAFVGAEGVVLLLAFSIVLSGAGAILLYAFSQSFRKRCLGIVTWLLVMTGVRRMDVLADSLLAFPRGGSRFPFMIPVLPSSGILVLLRLQHGVWGDWHGVLV